MCSLTAVYINQYIYQTAAAYCVCRFEWAKDTKGVSMLCKKGPSSSFPFLVTPLVSPPHLSLSLRSSLSCPPPRQPFACPPITHTDIKITQWDPTADTPLRLPPLASVSCLWRTSGVVIPLSFSLRPFSFSSVLSTATVLLFFNMWGTGGFQWFYLSFLFLIREGGYVRAAFPHLGLRKHTPWRPVPPLSPLLSLTALPSPALLPRLSLFVCTVWTIVLVNNYYSTPPPPQVGKYNSIFLCALGNLYNSILNLNETIKKKTTHMLEKQLKRDIREEEHRQILERRLKKKARAACLSFCFLFGFSYFLLVFQEATLKL